MTFLIISILLMSCICEEIIGTSIESEKATSAKPIEQANNDLSADASTYYSSRYSEWARNNYPNNYDVTGYGLHDDKNHNYGGVGYYDNNGYDHGYIGNSGYRYDRQYNYRGNGGYGGYGGNNGLNSYYGYNLPNYQGGYHLGYGYYKRPGYGNIYNNGITPSLVTGYRGYSK